MFKIEIEGKTILHTGDFRAHGYTGYVLERVLRNYVKQVDILITEGTMLGRKNEAVLLESDIENNVVEALRKSKYVYALCSSTDIDRLRALHNACKATGRTFVCDRYQYSVLDIFNKYTLSERYKFNRVFKLINYKTKNVYQKLSHTGFLVMVRPSSYNRIKRMMRTYNDQPSALIYSMWQGYHNGTQEQINEDIVKMRQLFGGNIYDGTRDGFHTSGHASVETLQMVCRCVKPRLGIVPIHKDANTSFKNLPIADDYCIIESDVVIDNINIRVQ
jgi:ribonuclease J